LERDVIEGRGGGDPSGHGRSGGSAMKAR
jgi:hypothetical protein